MKTKNNVQKTNLKSIAIAVIFGIICFTVNAQDLMHFAFENQRNNDLSLAIISGKAKLHYSFSKNSTSDNAFIANYLKTEKEETLEIESWMIDEHLFDVKMLIEQVAENPLQIEDWMTVENNFGTFGVIIEETENPMELENWMTDNNLFSTTNMVFSIENEVKLELENWMINDEVFNVEPKTETNKVISGTTFVYIQLDEPSLKMEKWMVSNKNWRK